MLSAFYIYKYIYSAFFPLGLYLDMPIVGLIFFPGNFIYVFSFVVSTPLLFILSSSKSSFTYIFGLSKIYVLYQYFSNFNA